MNRKKEPPPRPNAHWWFALGFLIVALSALLLWNGLGEQGDGTGTEAGRRVKEGPLEPNSTDLIAPSEAERHAQATASDSETNLEGPSSEIEDADDGWGQVIGTAAINGLPLESGRLHWTDPTSGEQGYASIETGQFEFDAPAGEVKVTAWVVSHNGFIVSNHQSNSVDNLTRVELITIHDAKPTSHSFEWLYDEVRVEGDARAVPSQTPVAGTDLYIRGTKSPCTVHVRTDSAGYFVATVPSSPALSISCNSGRATITTPVLDGWTELRIPDTHTIEVEVRDGRNGELITDYDFFFCESGTEGQQIMDWKRLRTGGPPPAASGAATGQDTDNSLSLPTGEIDLFIYAPRLGLAPHRQKSLEVGPHAPRIEVTLQPGGTLAFSCEQPPPTGLVKPDYDPDPILVVEEYMFQWNERSAASFGKRVMRKGALPLPLLFTRRLNFNLQGEALVQGLPTGTYRVLHWREDVNWRSEPLEVVAGVTTNVHLVPE